jgi:hypothetical protein
MRTSHSVSAVESLTDHQLALERKGPANVRVVDTAIRAVRTKRISLNFALKDVGPSGVSVLELWYTQDGKQWKMCEVVPKSPPYVVEVEEEGRYGFTLVARSGAGLATRRPVSGDEPQVWVLVDQTTPDVQLIEVAPTAAGRSGNALTIRWKAADANFGRVPITLSYAERSDGPWQTIAANVANTGHYTWQLPQGLPSQFLVRVEAVDLAGNVGAMQTPTPVVLDCATPTAAILSVEAGVK